MDIYSKLLHERISYENSLPSVTPIFQSSGYEYGSENFYGRKSTPNDNELEKLFSYMENSNFSIVTTTGYDFNFCMFTLIKTG